MKKHLILLAMAGFILTAGMGQGNDPVVVLSARIAQRMKDTLSLTDTQKAQLYNINLQLQNQKKTAWQQHADPDEARPYVQSIENTRDSLYQPILTSGQFILYRQKKRNLVNNN